MIHLLNGQDTKILDVIPKGNYWGDNHHRSLKSNLEKCEFMTHANKRFSPYLAERNRIIIPGERPESYREFIIFQVHKMKNNQMKVYGKASYLDDIKKSKVIRPGKTEAKSNVSHVEDTLSSTGWLPGNIIYKGIRTLGIENYTNPFAFLKRLASEFELELRFRIELENYEVVRYVDMVEPTGVWRGREVEFGKDLLNISRKENTADIVTALIGVGPEREDGTRLEVLVEDKDALKRWGRNGQHLIAYYEPQSTDQNMTKERLRTLTENELEKRVKAVVEYESEIADLGNVAGLRNKEFYFGDQIKIKDTTFNPPLYLEARIHTMDRPFKRKSARKKVTLGDYKELTEEEVHAIWRSLQAEIRKKISNAELLERTYDKETIDQKDMPGNQAKDKLDAEVGSSIIETTTGAQEKANQAESNVKKFAVPKEVYEQKVQELIGDINFKADKDITDAIQSDVNDMRSDVNKNITDIASKVDAKWVNGQLVSKADKADTYTIADVDAKFDNTVSLTEYKTDKKGIITDLESHETRIRQTETDITAKVDNTQYQQDKDTLQTEINKNSVDIQINAEGLASKVDSTTYNTDKHGMITDINSNKSSIEQQADMIRSKVDATYVKGELGKIEVGGRNLLLNSKKRTVSPRNTGESSDNFNFADFYLVGDQTTQPGQVYTFRAKIEITHGDFDTITILEYNPGGVKKYIPINNEGYVSTTFEASGGRRRILVYAGQSGLTRGNGMIIHEAKFEKGNKATDWTPAPEDTQAEIESVEKYASEIEQTAKGIEQNVSAIKTDHETFKSTANSTFKQQADLIEGKVSETIYNKDKKGIITDLQQHDSRITQNADQIEFKASKNELNQATQRISTAESQINVMAGKLEFKAESSEVNALGERVDSAEITIDGLKSEIEFKADRIELEGFVTANDLKVRGDLEFGGKLRGATGTFSGEVEAAQLIIDNPDIEQDGGVGLRLQTAMWQESTSKPFKRTGHLEFNTLNDALEIYKVNLSGNEVPLDGFRINVKRSEFLGDVVASESLYANRLFAKTIYSSHYPDKFIINDYENGSVSVNALGNNLYLGYVNTNEVISDSPFRTTSFYANSVFANSSNNLYLRTPKGGEVRVTTESSTAKFGSIRASSYEIGNSLREKKTDIEIYTKDALNVIRNGNAYLYKIKGEEDQKHKQLGLMVDETPREIHGKLGDNIEIYALGAFLFRGIKQADEHASKGIKDLKVENQMLKKRVKQLELRFDKLEGVS